MNEWITLVRQRMGEFHLTQERLAERLGVSQGAVNHWLSGRREPGLAMMNRILQVLGQPLEVATVLRAAEARGQYGAATEGVPASPGARYPCLSWAQLATGVGAAPSASRHLGSDYLALGPACWVQVDSEAMTAAQGWSVPRGMWVLVDSGRPLTPGCLAVARVAGAAVPVLRQYREEGGRGHWRPLNPAWPVREVQSEDETLGTVVQAWGEFLFPEQH